ncbi:Non-hem dioxygenase N-terminal domain-containing protein [Hirschfeldia incana]|nr:Non-hem dioxygenase N-terminal domain-containing protein [Hirschfeldia incana]
MEKPKFKSVQEVITAGGGLPERYLYTSAEGQPLNCLVPEMDIPAIDLSLLLSSSDDGREELRKLHSALSTWGVVQMNHGITEALLDKIYEVTKRFFALSAEEKQKYARETGSFQAYGNDMILLDDQVLDWTDRLYLTTYPEDQRQLKLWPRVPIKFSLCHRERSEWCRLHGSELVEDKWRVVLLVIQTVRLIRSHECPDARSAREDMGTCYADTQ